MDKKQKPSINKGLKKEGYRRFVFLERPKQITKTFEVLEILYHTVLPFMVGLMIHFDNPQTLLWSLIMILPLMFRFYQEKGKQKMYFRLN